MKTILINIWLLLSCATLGYSQQVSLEKYAPCLFGDTMESSALLSMNDMGMEFGYINLLSFDFQNIRWAFSVVFYLGLYAGSGQHACRFPLFDVFNIAMCDFGGNGASIIISAPCLLKNTKTGFDFTVFFNLGRKLTCPLQPLGYSKPSRFYCRHYSPAIGLLRFLFVGQLGKLQHIFN